MSLVLSLFPGIDLLGRGFEAEGFVVLRGPDTLYGGDVRDFTLDGHAAECHFAGVIGGPPCQDFSKARRAEPTGEGLELMGHYLRIVTEAGPDWWLMENVAGSPEVSLPGYHVQRFTLNARECGLVQNRLRKFHFGFKDGKPLVIARGELLAGPSQKCCLDSEGRRAASQRRAWPDFCELQGLPRAFDLPAMSRAGKYQAVGNGVPVPMARVIARAIKSRSAVTAYKLCECDCGRLVFGNQRLATPACRKRMERRRRAVSGPGDVTAAESQLLMI